MRTSLSWLYPSISHTYWYSCHIITKLCSPLVEKDGSFSHLRPTLHLRPVPYSLSLSQGIRSYNYALSSKHQFLPLYWIISSNLQTCSSIFSLKKKTDQQKLSHDPILSLSHCLIFKFPFTAKLLQRVVYRHCFYCIASHSFLSPFQSGFSLKAFVILPVTFKLPNLKVTSPSSYII